PVNEADVTEQQEADVEFPVGERLHVLVQSADALQGGTMEGEADRRKAVCDQHAAEVDGAAQMRPGCARDLDNLAVFNPFLDLLACGHNADIVAVFQLAEEGAALGKKLRMPAVVI